MDARTLLNPANRQRHARFVRGALRPAAAAYRAIGAVRNTLYDLNLCRSHRLGVPTISVGNLSAGGTGKTPMVIEVVRRLQAMGHHPAILHRGYGGRGGPSDEHRLFVATLGDNVPVMANPSRRAGASKVLRRWPTTSVFVLDDGFQHRGVHRDLDLVLVDISMPLRDAQMLPAGLMREPVTALRRADGVVLTHLEQVEAAVAETVERDIERWTGHPPLARTRHAWLNLRCDEGPDLPLSALAGRHVLVACGIGNPDAFATTARRYAGRVDAVRPFADHQRFDQTSAQQVLDDARRVGSDTVLITEKDWVKWAPIMAPIQRHGLKIWRPRLNIVFDAGEAAVEAALRQSLPLSDSLPR